jgi:hypothetical protein
MKKTGITHTILTHERPEMLDNLVVMLRSDLAHSQTEGQIIVVDDGSTSKKAASTLLSLEANATIVLRKDHDLKMPRSWARNINRAMRRADFDIVFHWDDDTLIEGVAGWSGRIAQTLRDCPELGALCPRRTGIMEPYVPVLAGARYAMSFGLTEPCFAMRYDTIVRIGPIDESLGWFYGPDLALRIIENGLECGFDLSCRQLDLCVRTEDPNATFPLADGGPYYEKWTRYYGKPEQEWTPFTRHHRRIAEAEGRICRQKDT